MLKLVQRNKLCIQGAEGVSRCMVLACRAVREFLKPYKQLERAGADVGPQGRGRGGLQGAGQCLCTNVTYKGTVAHREVQRAGGGCAPRLDALGPSPAQWGLGGQNRRRERAQGGAKSKRSCF